VKRAELFIREANNDDCAGVISLVASVLAEFQLPFFPDSKDADLADIEGMYIQRGGLFEVIQDKSGRLLGAYGLFPLNDMTCELRKMYFLREIRGIGLGREVLERAADHARRLGFKIIVLETISVLDRAIELYRRFGFVPAASEHPNARVDQRFRLDM
jgi:putative acetyltransferase